MDESGSVWGRALRDSNAFLGRWADPLTHRERDDLAQEAVLVAWRNKKALREPHRLGAFVRTVARRLRARAVRSSLRNPEEWLAGDETAVWPEAQPGKARQLRIGHRLVPEDWLLDCLQVCLRRLGSTNRRLLASFYEGFSCSELSDRFGLSEAAVKVRLHRGRASLRQMLEDKIRMAGCFGE